MVEVGWISCFVCSLLAPPAWRSQRHYVCCDFFFFVGIVDAAIAAYGCSCNHVLPRVQCMASFHRGCHVIVLSQFARGRRGCLLIVPSGFSDLFPRTVRRVRRILSWPFHGRPPMLLPLCERVSQRKGPPPLLSAPDTARVPDSVPRRILSKWIDMCDQSCCCTHLHASLLRRRALEACSRGHEVGWRCVWRRWDGC